MKDRIKQLMDSLHLTQQKFAEDLGISPASLSSIFNGRTKPTINHVDAIVIAFPNINLRWLMYGEGDMFVAENNTSAASSEQKASTTAFSQQEEQLLDFGSDQSPLTQQTAQPQRVQQQQFIPQAQHKPEIETVKIINKPQRQISEIRIFYDDQTWETFVPKK